MNAAPPALDVRGVGHSFGSVRALADVSLTPHLVALPRLGVELGSAYPNVTQWLERLKARPNFAKSAN